MSWPDRWGAMRMTTPEVREAWKDAPIPKSDAAADAAIGRQTLDNDGIVFCTNGGLGHYLTHDIVQSRPLIYMRKEGRNQYNRHYESENCYKRRKAAEAVG